jgi:adenylylsulfate kinase-like enzyme
MSGLRVIVAGPTASGKSTAARVITKALRDAGLLVSLTDPDDVNLECYSKGLKALQGTPVLVECVQAKEME